MPGDTPKPHQPLSQQALGQSRHSRATFWRVARLARLARLEHNSTQTPRVCASHRQARAVEGPLAGHTCQPSKPAGSKARHTFACSSDSLDLRSNDCEPTRSGCEMDTHQGGEAKRDVR